MNELPTTAFRNTLRIEGSVQRRFAIPMARIIYVSMMPLKTGQEGQSDVVIMMERDTLNIQMDTAAALAITDAFTAWCEANG